MALAYRQLAQLGLCSSTPRGDGNASTVVDDGMVDGVPRFMQLNPARGRKPRQSERHAIVGRPEVYAAQPREGFNPARGRKQGGANLLIGGFPARFM